MGGAGKRRKGTTDAPLGGTCSSPAGASVLPCRRFPAPPMSQPIPDDADLNRKEQEIYALRQEKARKWREKGVNPWSSGYRPKNLIAAILEKHGKQTAGELEANAAEYEIAGRMMALRSFGKAAFIKVRDRSGES